MTTLALLVPAAGTLGFWAGVLAEQHRQEALTERVCLDD
jgi:hypothetical protein